VFQSYHAGANNVMFWGHPFMTSTWRGKGGSGSGGRGRGVQPHVDVHTEN